MSNEFVSGFFTCGYNATESATTTTDDVYTESIVTYGTRFNRICNAIAAQVQDSNLVDYHNQKNIMGDGVRISNIDHPVYIDRVNTKVLLIDNCKEVHIGVVDCDYIAIQETATVSLSNVEASQLITFKCNDVAMNDFRITDGCLHGHCVRLGDGSARTVSVLSDILHINGALDRMTYWNLYSPVCHIGPMVPPMRPTNRLNLYANMEQSDAWVGTHGRCSLRQIVKAANSIFSQQYVQQIDDVLSDETRDTIKGMLVINTIIKMMTGGSSLLAPADDLFTVADSAVKYADSQKNPELKFSDEETTVFDMIAPFNERRIVSVANMTATVSSPGCVVVQPLRTTFSEAGVTPSVTIDPDTIIDPSRSSAAPYTNTPTAQPTVIGGHVHIGNQPPATTDNNNNQQGKVARTAAAKAQAEANNSNNNNNNNNNK